VDEAERRGSEFALRRQGKLAVAVAFADGNESGFVGEEGINDLRREMSSPVLDDDGLGDAVGKRVLVDTLAGQGVIDVGQGDDAAAEGDGFAFEAVWIAVAVPAARFASAAGRKRRPENEYWTCPGICVRKIPMRPLPRLST
jgi:hypothetical protein